MSRSLEAAAVVGGVALLGAGVAPFLHRDAAPDIWFSVQWPPETDADDALGLLRHVASTRRPSVVAFEVEATSGRITYRVGVAKSDGERLRHVFATYLPGVLLEPVERRSPKFTHAVEVRLGSRERALRTDAAVEISRSVTGALIGAAVTTTAQWLLGPRLTPTHVPKNSVGLPSTGRALKQAVFTGNHELDARARTALQLKVGEQGFRAALRIATTHSDPKVAHGTLRAVVGGLRVAEAAGAHLKVRRIATTTAVAARPPRRWSVAVNVGELLGLLAWPLGDGDYRGVTRLGSRRLPVPEDLSAQGLVIGEGSHPQTRRPVAMNVSDSLTHLHVLGPTGVGKSTLLANYAVQLIEQGHGVVVIEPRGDLVADVLDRIPRERQSDVVVLDPNDTAMSIGLNPLTGGSPEMVTDHVLAIFQQLYGDYLGPRSTDVLVASLQTLARSEDATLCALPVLLSDASFRKTLTAPLRGDIALASFWNWYESISDQERGHVISPLMNKLRPLLLREHVRLMLGQSRPRFDIADVFNKRTILLVPLTTGTLGSEAAGLIGSLVVAAIWTRAQQRSQVAREHRHPVTLIADEVQHYLRLPTDLGDVLAQARGYGVAFVAAHQHLAQLNSGVRAAMLANARSRVCFRLSAEDAAVIARSTDRLDASDLQHLDRYETYASLMADGTVQPYCSVVTNPLPEAASNAAQLRDMSRTRFGRPKAEIEAELSKLVSSNPTDQSPGRIGRQRRTER